MSFSVSYTASSKSDALDKLHAAEAPASVRAFIAAAIEGFSEPGGNHPHIHGDDPGLKEVQAKNGLAINPVAITVSASGHLDTAGNSSSCSISVSKAA